MKLHLPPNIFPTGWTVGPQNGLGNVVKFNGGRKRHALVSDLKRVDGVRQLDGA